MIPKLLTTILGERQTQRKADLHRNLIRHEARIGGEVFGPIPAGHRREFFCLDKDTWVWHEEWTDVAGQKHLQTTRYDIRSDGLIKAQHGQYKHVSADETARFKKAVKSYLQRVNREIYGGMIQIS